MACTQFWSLIWEFHLMTAHTQVHSVSLLWVFTPTLLNYFTKSFTCSCQCHACDHVLVMLKVLALCVHVVFTMKTSVTLTHEVTYTIAQALSRSTNDQSQVSCLSLTLSEVMFSMCVQMVWVISSSSHVSVCLQDHICMFSLIHTLSHFDKVLTTELPSKNWTIIPPLTWSTFTQNNIEPPIKLFQVVLPARKLISLHASQPKSLTREPPRH